MMEVHRWCGRRTPRSAVNDNYEGCAVLNRMIAGGTASPMCLVKAKFLEDVLASDHCLPSREDLPSQAAFDASINDKVLVVALSYCWCKREHPDPEKLVAPGRGPVLAIPERAVAVRNRRLLGLGQFVPAPRDT